MLYLRAGTYELNAPRSEQIVPRVQHGQVNATSAPEPQHDCAANSMSSTANRAMQEEASVDTSSGPNFQRQLGDKIAKIKASYEQIIIGYEEKIRLLSVELDKMKMAIASAPTPKFVAELEPSSAPIDEQKTSRSPSLSKKGYACVRGTLFPYTAFLIPL